MTKAGKLEEVVKEGPHGTIADLQVQPVSFKAGVYETVKDYIAYYRELDEDYDN